MTDETAERGELCKIFGITPRNRILEFFLEMREIDFGRGDVDRETGLNRATTYNTVEELIRQEIIVPTRKLGNTQLYKLNIHKPEVRALIEAFNVLLENIVKENNSEQLVEA